MTVTDEYNYTHLATSIFCPIIKVGFISTSVNLSLTDRMSLLIELEADKLFQLNTY